MNLSTGKESIKNCQSVSEAIALMPRCVELRSFISLHDHNGAYIDVSDTYHGITGRSLETVKGDSAYSFFHPDDLKTVLKSHAYVTLKTDLSEVKVRFRRSDGSYVRLTSHSKQIKGDGPNYFIVVFSHVDS